MFELKYNRGQIYLKLDGKVANVFEILPIARTHLRLANDVFFNLKKEDSDLCPVEVYQLRNSVTPEGLREARRLMEATERKNEKINKRNDRQKERLIKRFGHKITGHNPLL